MLVFLMLASQPTFHHICESSLEPSFVILLQFLVILSTVLMNLVTFSVSPISLLPFSQWNESNTIKARIRSFCSSRTHQSEFSLVDTNSSQKTACRYVIIWAYLSAIRFTINIITNIIFLNLWIDKCLKRMLLTTAGYNSGHPGAKTLTFLNDSNHSYKYTDRDVLVNTGFI